MDNTKIHIIGRIDQIVRDYFDAHPSIAEIKAKELMPIFIKKGIFIKDHREGLPIRNILRDLDKENLLSLLNNCKVVRNKINRNWYFVR